MRPGSTAILFVIFMLLSSYVYFFETGPKDVAGEAEKVETLLDVNPAEVAEVRLKTKKNKFTFEKRDGQWRMMSPVQMDVLNSRVETLFSVFKYPVINEIESDPPDVSLYGLDDPEFELGFKTAADEPYTTLLVGDDSPYGINCYAKLSTERRVVLVGLLYKQVLDQDLRFFKSDQ